MRDFEDVELDASDKKILSALAEHREVFNKLILKTKNNVASKVFSDEEYTKEFARGARYALNYIRWLLR